MDDLFAKHDALAVAELIRRAQARCWEVLDATMATLRKLNGTLNAITDFYEDAPSAAEGPFQGVPYVIKQLMADCAGHPTTLGSKFFAKQPVAAADSAAVARMRKAGLVIVGRTNTSEFGLAPTTEPAFGGATVNPWRTDLSPGGSSGGSAAIVAARGLPMAHADRRRRVDPHPGQPVWSVRAQTLSRADQPRADRRDLGRGGRSALRVDLGARLGGAARCDSRRRTG